MEKDFFDKYKEAKFCLYSMVVQFLDAYISINDIEKYGINYSKDDFEYKIDNTSEYFNACFHNFESEGLLAWNYLEIDKPFITFDEIWDKRSKIAKENIKDDVNYYEMYLKISILLIDMVEKYYRASVSINDIKDDYIDYDKEEDVWDNQICACHHMFESAGENTWIFFDIEKPYVGMSVFDKKRDFFSSELLKMEEKKLKIKMK